MDYGVAKGHLRLTSLSNLKDINLDLYDKKLFIVRSTKQGTMNNLASMGIVHVPQLSPSPALFSDYYNRWKDGTGFTADEVNKMKNGLTHSWWDLYTERFIEEIKTRHDIRKCLKRTKDLLDQGYNVLYICYCSDYKRCHRSILGYLFAEKGYDVFFE